MILQNQKQVQVFFHIFAGTTAYTAHVQPSLNPFSWISSMACDMCSII